MMANQVVAITGAGKGLGRAYALHLARCGAHVVVNNRRHAGESSSSADATVADIVAGGGKAAAEYSAIEDPLAGQRLLDCALDNYGRLDVVIANAGVSENRSFVKQSTQQFREVIEINLLGTANVLHPAFAYMYRLERGCMILTTSTAGLFGGHGLPAYSASKAGLVGLALSLSQEGAAHGVRVNVLAPYAATQMTEAHLPKAIAKQCPTESVAEVIAWLADDQCPLSGEIVIAGANRIGRARMLTSVAASAEPMDDAVWEEISSVLPSQQFDSAVAHFQEFIAETRR